jgi:protocatechuate 4,5-dioxygenase alpha chain
MPSLARVEHRRNEGGPLTVAAARKSNARDLQTSSYDLSRALYDLREPRKRATFLADQEAYARSYSLNAEEREMLLRHDWRGLAEAGVSIYLLTKLAAALKVDFVEMEAAMRGMNKQEFVTFLKQQAERNKRYALLLE